MQNLKKYAIDFSYWVKIQILKPKLIYYKNKIANKKVDEYDFIESWNV